MRDANPSEQNRMQEYLRGFRPRIGDYSVDYPNTVCKNNVSEICTRGLAIAHTDRHLSAHTDPTAVTTGFKDAYRCGAYVHTALKVSWRSEHHEGRGLSVFWPYYILRNRLPWVPTAASPIGSFYGHMG